MYISRFTNINQLLTTELHQAMSKIVPKLSTSIVALIFVTTLIFVGFGSSPYIFPMYTNIKQIVLILGLIVAFIIVALPPRSNSVSKLKLLFWVIAVLIAFPFAVTKIIFGANELDAILIFFRDNQAQDITSIGGDSFLAPIITAFVMLLLLVLTSLFLVWRVKKFDSILVFFGILLLAVSPITLFVKNTLVTNQVQADFKFKEEMGIEILERPSEKKNLIILYLESVERTYKDIESTKSVYQPIQRFSESGLEATNMHQTIGTNITIAGIVASQCGVPLLSQGLRNIFFKMETEGSLDQVLPSITCLGDILSEDGYDMSYINGASLNRFSKRGFFTSHGYKQVFGLDEVPVEKTEGRTNVFGMNDALMFEYVYEEYDRLITKDDPFVLSILTVSTHGPDAYLDVNCPMKSPEPSRLPRAMECTFKLVEDFIKYTKSKGNGRDTEIVLMSDHLAMKNTLVDDLRENSALRRNLFAIENDGEQMVLDRNSTMMDIYPTLLEQLGYTIAEGKGNLGRSLFSEKRNLIERYGSVDLAKLLRGNHELSSYIWRPLDAD